jgi:alkyl hydroperoxide reductase subunit AhpF
MTSAADPDLLAERDRLTEQFAVAQSELGGVFYEMAIRDHVRMDVLVKRAAEMQRLDAELAAVQRLLDTGDTTAAGNCPACGAVYARGAAYCAHCATPLVTA